MKHFFKTYLPFVRAGIMQTLSYRMNFIFFIVGEIFSCFVMYFVWQAVFKSTGSNTFMGFSMNDMVVYLFISFLTAGFITYSDGAYALGREIIDGSITTRMIRPCSFDMTFLFTELGDKIVIILFTFIPIAFGVELYRYFSAGEIMLTVPNFLLYILSASLAYLISFYFNVCYGFLAFFLKNLWGTSILKETIVGFLSGSVIPLIFLPGMLKNILQYLPFASLNYTPVMLYMGKLTTNEILFSLGLQVVWLAMFWGLSKLIWASAIKRLEIQGG